LFFLSAGLFLAGTLGLEMAGGRYVEMHGNGTFTYALIATVEETLELIGLVVFLYALMALTVRRQRAAKDRHSEFK
jgi:uncharacterized membrane protein